MESGPRNAVLPGVMSGCRAFNRSVVRRVPAVSAGNVFLGVLPHASNWRFKELRNVMARGKP